MPKRRLSSLASRRQRICLPIYCAKHSTSLRRNDRRSSERRHASLPKRMIETECGIRGCRAMLRSFLERATRRTSFRRSLPTLAGGVQIYVSGSAGLKYLFRPMKSVDPVLCSTAEEFVKKGHVVWDVGANIGLFSFAAAHLAGDKGRVFAFEADVWLVQLLRRSASIQPSTSGAV